MMNRKKFFRRLACVSLLLAASAGAGAQQNISIVPKPLHLAETGEQFVFKSGMSIACEEGLKEQAEYLSQMLRQATGWEIKVRISGADEAGVFYGLQTLLQLLPEEVYRNRLAGQMKWTVPGVQIVDYPERPWRGMMLDVARYFYDKEFVKKFIDMMAMYKLNKLQFHLIDDSGWRLEIKKYPRLTEVGAWAGPDSRRLGGYYTQDDIREILEYARLRQVEVIPEIEFPAHMLSAVVAYPWLGCTGKQHDTKCPISISSAETCFVSVRKVPISF